MPLAVTALLRKQYLRVAEFGDIIFALNQRLIVEREPPAFFKVLKSLPLY